MKSCSKLAFHKPFPDGANYVLSVPLISVWTVLIARPVDIPITAFLRSKFSCGCPETVLFGGRVNTEYSNGSSHVSLFTSYPNSAGSVEALNLPAQFSHFSSGGYICLIQARPQSEQLLQGLSTADTSVYVWATLVSEQSTTGMQRVLIPFIPAFSINQSELVLSHKQDIGEIRVLGVDRVLEKLEVC